MNEQSLKEKLKFIAKEKDLLFNDAWKQLTLERFLVRISQSEYSDKFIFKGGLLLARYIEIGRETKDIDFLVQNLDAQKDKITGAFKDISSIDINDEFHFSFLSISQLDQTHMNYPGFRVKLNVKFGKMKDIIQVDIGAGDAVKPKVASIELYKYRGNQLFEKSVSLKSYPMETIFSEKLETIISKGVTNSRMKDYHDLILICRTKNLIDIKELKESIESTFKYRSTHLKLPIIFSQEEYTVLQRLWNEHIKKLGATAIKLSLPPLIENLIQEINDWLNQRDCI